MNNIFTGFWFFGLQECFKRKGEKEREKLGGQKDMSERRIATDLHYYYGEIEYKIKACLKLHVS